jgi:hypothetical protein
MKILFAVLRLLPLILPLVRAVEEAVPLPGQGRRKLDLVLTMLKQVYDGADDLAREFSFEKLAAIVVPVIGTIVDMNNELGLFQKSPPPVKP